MNRLLQKQSVQDVRSIPEREGQGIRKVPVIISQFAAAQERTKNGEIPWDLCEILYIDQKQKRLAMKTTENLAPQYDADGEVAMYDEEWMIALGTQCLSLTDHSIHILLVTKWNKNRKAKKEPLVFLDLQHYNGRLHTIREIANSKYAARGKPVQRTGESELMAEKSCLCRQVST